VQSIVERPSEQRTSGDRLSNCDAVIKGAVKQQVVRVLMMSNAKNVAHLPY